MPESHVRWEYMFGASTKYTLIRAMCVQKLHSQIPKEISSGGLRISLIFAIHLRRCTSRYNSFNLGQLDNEYLRLEFEIKQ